MTDFKKEQIERMAEAMFHKHAEINPRYFEREREDFIPQFREDATAAYEASALPQMEEVIEFLDALISMGIDTQHEAANQAKVMLQKLKQKEK